MTAPAGMDVAGGERGSPEAALVAVSVAQLVCGLTGLAVAVQRGHAFDVGFSRGRSERVGREAVVLGTALSAPGPMLAAQGVLTARVARSRDPRAVAGLRVLGAAMSCGYLAERLVRRRLRRRGWDPVESPLAVTGISLSVAMVVVGRRAGAGGPSTATSSR